MRRLNAPLLLLFLLAFRSPCQTPVSRAGAQKALVIGMGAYRQLPRLAVCSERTRAVSAAFRRLRYEVSERIDTDIAGLTAIVRGFMENLRLGDAAVFYFCGYAIQSASENYLLPVDFPPTGADLYSQAYSFSRVELGMRNKGAEWRVLILDASRSNPALAQRFPEPGLAPPNLGPDGAFVAYSAPAGKPAQDDPANPLGVFTSELLNALQTPGLTPEQVFRRVQKAVKEKDGLEPLVASNIGTEYYMTGEPPPDQDPRPHFQPGR